ncbi:MAG TPA: alpha/beta hydrolase [bacterium]|nr:alpha/beta hydrolase [bacterium]
MTRINAGALALDYELRGHGPPLLMINGFRRSRVVWLEPLLEALEPHFQMILFDNRGTGDSDKPEDGYTIEAFADDCAALLEALHIPRAHVFGTSMGGMIAQRVATRHPQRVHGLALGCTNCGKGSVPPEKRIWELLRLLPDAQMDAREVARRQEEAYVTDAFRAVNRPLLDRLFEIVNESPTPVHAVKGHLAAIEAFDACDDLERIQAPTLVITGAEDRLIPAENSRRMAERIPRAKLNLLPEAAHFFWVEKPRETAQALTDFLGALG